jgi:hypothetical protein
MVLALPSPNSYHRGKRFAAPNWLMRARDPHDDPPAKATTDAIPRAARGSHERRFAASWAHRSLPAKNTLTAADAELVEMGFRIKLTAFGDERPAEGLREAVRSRPTGFPLLRFG